jgi:hypothetical protein
MMEDQTIINKRTLPIRILIFINCILLAGHLLLERNRGDLNWLRLGDRSLLSKAYIGIEGAVAMTLFLAVFGYFYPNMKNMVTSKLTLLTVCVVGVEVVIWLFYR